MSGGHIQGSGNGTVTIAGVSTDSRKVERGQLFIPLQGDNFDGHHYVAGALEGGAAAAMWQTDHPVPAELRDAPLVLVEDTLAALQELASAYRLELPVRVVGITGSNGKTTTKDMVAAILGTTFKVHKTFGNLNNHIGLPLTVLQLAEDTEAAVLEMGMSGFGEIELLTRIAQPDAAIITNIGDAHLLQLGSRAGIARAKLEIAAGLREDGLFVYNGDEPLLVEGVKGLQLPAGAQLQSFGIEEKDANYWLASSIAVDATSSSFDVSEDGVKGNLTGIALPVPGRHNVSNALAAIAIGRRFGVEDAAIRQGLSELLLTGMRIEPRRAYNGAMLLNDAYNANPTAVRAAIDLLEQLSGFRRKWLVLADMLELGPEEAELHREIGAYVDPSKADALLLYGQLSEHTAAGAKANYSGDGVVSESALGVRYFTDKSKLIEALLAEVAPEDLVLVKGSRGMRMEQVVQAMEQGQGV